MRSGKACSSRSPSRCAGASRGGVASTRRRRRHCLAAWSMRRQRRARGIGADAAGAERRQCLPAIGASRRCASAADRAPRPARPDRRPARCSSRCDGASSIAASRGCVPSASMRRPSGVIAPPSSAPSRCSSSRAAASAPVVAHRRSAGWHRPTRPVPAPARPVRPAPISGRRCGSRRCDSGHSRYAQPSATRPARPARWSAEACAMLTHVEPGEAAVGVVARFARESAVDHHAHAGQGHAGFGDIGGEHDAAMAVADRAAARAIAARPGARRAGSARRHACPARSPTSASGRAPVCTLAISRCPGRNTSTSPGCCVSACSTARRAWCSSASSRRAGKCATDDRIAAPGAAQPRRIEEGRQALAVQRRRHHHDAQVFAQAAPARPAPAPGRGRRRDGARGIRRTAARRRLRASDRPAASASGCLR